MMSIALRFIPILLEEMDRIMKAQQARGADFESGNLIQRAKGLYRFWCRFLSPQSDAPMIWLWPWKHAVITADRAVQR